MAKFMAVLEQGGDGCWSAYTLTPPLVIGNGPSREAAVADPRVAMGSWLHFMKETGQAVPAISAKLLTFEVAA